MSIHMYFFVGEVGSGRAGGRAGRAGPGGRAGGRAGRAGPGGWVGGWVGGWGAPGFDVTGQVKS